MDSSVRPVVYGASYSVYARAVRLALEEKGVAYEHRPVDIFAAGGPPAEHLRRHPFGRIPAFEHAGFTLYESGAIERYVDEAFAGPPLQPASPRRRARLTQLVGILDNYAYRPLVWDIFIERVVRPGQGRATEEARLQAGVAKARTCLAVLADLMGGSPWLAGDEISLADLHAAPMFDYFTRAPESAPLMAPHPTLQDWWARLARRPSLSRTAPPPD